MNIRRVFVLLGSVIPVFIITTSTIFSLNNIWVYYYNKGNNNAILYYEMLWKFHFFDFVIFVFPPLFLKRPPALNKSVSKNNVKISSIFYFIL